VDKCGVKTLEVAGILRLYDNGGVHYGRLIHKCDEVVEGVWLWHVMTWDSCGKRPWPGCTDLSAQEILSKWYFTTLVTGHNHKSFVVEQDGRLLVNPGSLTRQKADQIDHKPCVYLWYSKTNTVEPVYLPIEEDVISREHIAGKEERDERIAAFVSRLSEDYEVSLSFMDNLERFAQENEITEPIMQLVRSALEGNG
jgi:DNA repair exonuclease SbcCD nuclease subunit